jgi:DNA-binding NarL/FixJ family response regulator
MECIAVTTLEFRGPSSVRSCFRCGTTFHRARTERICPGCRIPATSPRKRLNPTLSFREKQVVHLVSQAKLNKEIAYELHLTEGTIKEYLNRIFRKVGTANRTELAVWAVKHLPASSDLSIADGRPPLRILRRTAGL